MQRRLCAAILVLEAIVLGLTTPVMIGVADVARTTALVIGLGLTLLCLLVSAMLRFRWAFAAGWAIQVAALGLGFVVPEMFFLGAVFLALWATAYLLGRTIERERAERSGTLGAE